MADWGILRGARDPGEAFQVGLEQGRQRRNELMTQEAMRAYATNPDDPQALNGLLQADPRLGLQLRQQQVTSQREQQSQLTKMIGGLAKQATTPQAWDAAVDQLVQMGVPNAEKYRGQFSPETRAAIMTAAGIKDDGQEEYTLAPGATRMRGGQVVASSPYRPQIITDPTTGQTFEYAPQGGGARPANVPQPGQVEDGYRFRGGNPADPASWEPIGGAPSQGGATFP